MGEIVTDEQILALCNSQLETVQQAELSRLLTLNREGELSQTELEQLDSIMQDYRRGLVRKAQAWKVAKARGLKTSIN